MLDMSLEVKLLENGLGGGWLGGWFFTGIKPLRGPTCKLEPARSKQSWIPSWTRVWQYIRYLSVSVAYFVPIVIFIDIIFIPLVF